jgi:hypothetical protein
VTLSLLKLPEEPAVSLELVHRLTAGPVNPSGFEHLVVQGDDLAATLERLTGARVLQRGRWCATVRPTGRHSPCFSLTPRVPDGAGGMASRTRGRHHRGRHRPSQLTHPRL